jgi:hypothetical protein
MDKKLTQKEKIDYMRISLAFIGISVNDVTVDIILQSYEEILKKGGKFSIEDMCKIEWDTKKKYEPRREIVAEKINDK